MTVNELTELNHIISNVAERTTREQNKRVPEIYTVVVDAVNSDGTVTAHFADNKDVKMNFPNLSGIQPNVGGSVYILTTGGASLTGAFVIAVRGVTTTYNAIISELQSQVLNLQNEVRTLRNNL